MDLSQKLLAAFLAAFFLIALLRVFRAPLRIALRLLRIHIPGAGRSARRSCTFSPSVSRKKQNRK